LEWEKRVEVEFSFDSQLLETEIYSSLGSTKPRRENLERAVPLLFLTMKVTAETGNGIRRALERAEGRKS
jgi:hypothetical protein